MPPDENPDVVDDDDDAALDAFVQEWEGIKNKVAAIPDDIGEQLAQISAKLGAGGGSSGTPTRAPAQPGGTPRARQATGEQNQPPTAPEKKPGPVGKGQWYFRPRRKRGE